MAFFKGRRKSDEDFKIALEREALEHKAGRESSDDSFVLPFARYDGTDGGAAPKLQAPHVLTPEELLGFNPALVKKDVGNNINKKPAKPTENIEMTKDDQSTPTGGQFLFQRMLDARKQAEEQSVARHTVPSVPSTPSATSVPTAPIVSTAPQKTMFENMVHTAATAAKEVQPAASQKQNPADVAKTAVSLPASETVAGTDKTTDTKAPTTLKSDIAQDSIHSEKPAISTEKTSTAGSREDFKIDFTPSTFGKPQPTEQKKSLLSKCDAFICDEDGNKYTSQSKEGYSLESVDSILKSFEERAIERANRRYGKAEDVSTTKSEPASPRIMKESGSYTAEQIFAMYKQANSANAKPKTDSVSNESVQKEPPKQNSAPARTELKEVPIAEHKVYTGKEPKILVETPDADKTAEVLEFQYSYADQTDSDVKPFIPKTPAASVLGGKVHEKTPEIQPDKTIQFNIADIASVATEQFNIPVPSPAMTDLPATEKLERNAKFKLFHSAEEENDPDDDLPFESEPYEDEELEDYTCIDDAESFRFSLNKSRSRLRVRFILTLFTAGLAALLATPLADSIRSSSEQIYLLANAGLVLLAILFNLNIISSIFSIFMGEPDMDLPAAAASVITLIYSVVISFVGDTTKAVPLALVAILSLLFGSVGKLSMISRIRSNFKQIATTEPKRAIEFIDDESTANIIAKGASLGDVRICAGRKTVNITNFLRNSYCRDPLETRVRLLLGIGSVAAFVLAVAVLMLSNGNVVHAFLAFTSVLCIIAAPSTLIISNLPLKVAASRLNCYGAMLTGYIGADEIDACNATVVDIGDLFPNGTVKLVDMRLLSPNPIDQSLLAAAALTAGAKSPLAGVFKQITDTTAAKIPPVDSITYEENMGISGWVSDRRVFVGNRTLLQTHGFALPSVEVDKRILRKGFFPVYLASDGVPCALLIVKYTADDEIAYELRRLSNTGTTVLVNSCDANTGADMICDYFGLYKDSVTIMHSSGVAKYKEVTNYKESVSAVASYGQSVCGQASVITAAINVKKLTAVMSAFYILFIIVGILATAVLSLTNKINLITPLTLSVYQLVTLLITCLPPYFKRP